MIQTNLLGRRGTAQIWDGVQTPVEVVGVFLNTHNPKHPSVSMLVKVTDAGKHTAPGDLHTLDAGRVSIV